jgi:hypothetical protein
VANDAPRKGDAIISNSLQALADMLQDPLLRRFHWLRATGRLAAKATSPKIRPGDDLVAGAELYLAASAAGQDERAALGLRQLLGAVDLAIAPSGITREGSSLRQRQLAWLLLACWLTARRGNRPEQWRLVTLARSLFAALQAITLPGGLPVVGGQLVGTVKANFLAELPISEQAAAQDLLRQARLDDLELLRQDGWLRLDCGRWAGLWHGTPGGWPMEGGLGHQDLGAAVLHWNALPLFIDAGAPPGGKTRDGDYRSAVLHDGITLNGQDPYPFDRPDFSDRFRQDVGGPAPQLRSSADGVQVSFDGYGRKGGHRQIDRHWHFSGDELTISDLVLGTGRPLIERRLLTPWEVTPVKGGLRLEQAGHRLILQGDISARLAPVRVWDAAGQESMATRILFAKASNLPWRGRLTVQPE